MTTTIKTNLASTLNIGSEGLVRLALSISPLRTLCIQGESGIGKSEIVGQISTKLTSGFYKNPENCAAMIADWNRLTQGTDNLPGWSFERGLPLVMRRLSQITEGDLLGIPDKASNGGTRFTLTDWVVFVCRYPCVLFLDERNRAQEAIKQAIFEMQDSHAFHGMKFHPDTRLILAENIGDQYSVQSLDPAEMSRALMVGFRPTVKDWLNWAMNGNVHGCVIDFIQQYEKGAQGEGYLEFRGTGDPGKKYPDRRAWKNLSDELVRLELFETPDDILFFHLSAALLGPEVAGKFQDFTKNRIKEISAEEILSNWNKAKKKLGKMEEVTQTQWISLTQKVTTAIKEFTITQEQAKQIGKFVEEIPSELKMMIWTASNGNEKNLHTILPHITETLRRVVTAEPTIPKVPTTTTTPTPRKR